LFYKFIIFQDSGFGIQGVEFIRIDQDEKKACSVLRLAF